MGWEATWFELPLELALAESNGSESTLRPAEPIKAARILVAEDNAVNQQITRAILEKAGFTVKIATDGAEVLEAVKTCEYDLVIMDVQMPRLDGYHATRAIRRLDSAVRGIPILAMTANAMVDDRERCLECGMDEYVSKPVHAAEILSKVGALLSKADLVGEDSGMANDVVDVACPCCHTLLRVDRESGAVLSHKVPEKPPAIEDLGVAARALKGGRRRSAKRSFRKSFANRRLVNLFWTRSSTSF